MRAIFILMMFSSCFGFSQKPAVYNTFSQLETRLKNGGDTTFVVNFWATWCVPCVEELPYFEELNRQSAGKKIRVLLVSLDYKSQFEKRLVPFVQEKKLASEVLLLADQDANSWMGKVNEKWDGAIPATWILKGTQQYFKVDKFKSFNELEQTVQPFSK